MMSYLYIEAPVQETALLLEAATLLQSSTHPAAVDRTPSDDDHADQATTVDEDNGGYMHRQYT